jgi:hypothetical protein
MRMFYRSAPVFMALSVALAGCAESDPPAAKSPAGSSANAQPGSSGTAAVDPSEATDVCLTVDGMH